MRRHEGTPRDGRANFIVRFLGHGYTYGHYALVFELLGRSLLEVLEMNDYRGLSLRSVRLIAKQLLEALSFVHEQGYMHSDVKPENILLVTEESVRLTKDATPLRGASAEQAAQSSRANLTPEDSILLSGYTAPRHTDSSSTASHRSSRASIRLIDFGAASRIGACPFTYIQSRYYRAPEVCLGAHMFSEKIDIWSCGCVLAELFLGLPLLPGTNDYHQVARMVDMFGVPPLSMIDHCKYSSRYFKVVDRPRPQGTGSTEEAPLGKSAGSSNVSSVSFGSRDFSSRYAFHLKTEQEFIATNADATAAPEPWQPYFNYATLGELVQNYPLSKDEAQWAETRTAQEKDVRASDDVDFLLYSPGAIAGVARYRSHFVDLLQRMFTWDPAARISAVEALQHPFFSSSL